MNTRDQAIANGTQDPVDAVGRCRAAGCPCIWTTKGSQLCRWHSAASPIDWAIVTDELQVAVTDRALERSNGEPAPHFSQAHKREILTRLRALFVQPAAGPRAWAHALKAREEAGERLSGMQKTMWRAALKVRAASDEEAR